MAKIENMTTKLVTTLKNEIIHGRLKAGDKLLPLRELALAHDVSRSVVNAAVSTLAAQGYVRVVPRHHIVVTDFLTTGTLGIVGDVIRSDNKPLQRKLTQDALALRLVLTLDAVKTISNNPRISLAPLFRISERALLWLNNPLRDYAKYWKLNQAFHETIVSLGDNYAYRLLYRNFRYIADGLVVLVFHNLDFITVLIQKQQLLLSALKDRDEKAAVALCRDLLATGAAETLRSYA